jgi:hypothetical protein
MSGEAGQVATARCHCGRLLRAAKSVSRGFGPRCWAKIAAATRSTDLSAFSAAQAAKAAEAIEQLAVVPLSRPGIYGHVSGDGTATYVVDTREQSCTCKAGQNGRRCYHLAAGLILDGAAPARRRTAA